MKKISIIGIGYIGSVAIPCLSKLGHEIIGVDIDSKKIKLINRGKSPLKEIGLDKLMKQQFKTGRIKATKDLKKAVKDSEIIFICVDTPQKKDGDIELKYLIKVCNDIGSIIKNYDDKKYIVIRSTVFPGTVENMQTLIEKKSGKEEGVDFHLLHHPEFMREGSSIRDFFDPSFIVVGSKNKLVGNYILGCYNEIQCKKFVVGVDVSQMIKYINNVFHCLKVDWANEIGSICKKLNIDGHEVMNLFCEDTQLNLSPYYLSPGFAWGAHCLVPGSFIHLKDGVKPIEKVNIGEEVLTHDKKFHKVTQRFVRKTTQGTIQINPKSLQSFELTGEHPVFAVQGFRKTMKNGKLRNNKITDWTPKWVLAEELKRGDYLVFAIPNEVEKVKELEVPNNLLKSHLVKVLIPNKIKITKDLMRLFGYYISEGTNAIKSIRLSFNSNSLNEINDVKNIIDKHFKLNLNISKVNPNKTCTNVTIYSKQLAGFMEKYCSKLAWNKKLHKDLMYLPLDLQKEFIKAAWITDGSLDKSSGCWTWATVSRQLFNQMKILLLRQSITFSTTISKAHKGKDGTNHREAYYIKIGNRFAINNFNKIMNVCFEYKKMKEKEHKTFWIDNGYLYYPISSIAKTDYKGLVYNLEVEGSHSYTCEGAVLHNCLPKEAAALTNIAKKLKVKTPLLNSVIPSNEEHIKRAIKLIEGKNKKKLGFLGLSSKAGTFDLRGNPVLKVIDYFKAKKYNIVLYDEFMEGTSLEKVLAQDLIIISTRDPKLKELVKDKSKLINLQE